MRFITLFHILTAATLFGLTASANNMYLSSLTSMNSDLSNDHITAICIDSYGFAWIGTASGLNRFDTHDIQIFREDDLGLYTDYVRAIYEDREEDVWIGTDSGLTMYDRDMDIFVPVSCRSNKGCTITKRVACIGEDNAGKIWISVGDQGLFCYDKEKSELRQFFFRNSGMLVERGISSFAFDGNNGLLASFYQDNLYYLDIESLQDENYLEAVPVSDYFDKDHITSVCHINGSNFAVASLTHGLCVVDVRSGDSKTLISNAENPFIPSNVIYRDNSLFVSTNDGIYIYSLTDGKVSHLQADSDNVHSLRNNDVNYVEYSKEHGLWLGLAGTGGVNFSIPDNAKFVKVSRTDGGVNLKGVNVTDFSYDRKRNVLYVATSYKGILEYSFADKSLKPLVRFQQPVESILYDNDIIYIGAPGGFYRYDIASGRIVREKAFSQININRLGSTSDRSIIIVGTTLGLYFYDKAAKRFEVVEGLRNYSITSFLDDGSGSLWLTTVNDGVFRLNIADRKVTEHYIFNPSDINTIPNNKCSCINMDNSGNIWVSTVGSGFCRIEEGKATRYNLKTHPDLPSNCFYGVLEDKNGNYWAKTDKGLVKCDFISGTFHTFDYNSGLLDNSLINYAQWESISGEIFLGSADGFFYFNPDVFDCRLTDYNEYDRPVFTNLYLGSSDDRKVTAVVENSPLSGSIDLAEHIELCPWDNAFTVTVSYSRLSNMADIPLLYMLEGHDIAPCTLAGDRVISYSNLLPGTYTLNVDGHKPLTVTVRQYWYLTAWAFAVYFLILIVLIVLVARYFYVLSARRTRRMQEERLFDEKLSFFSNVIHEIRTPIMLIKSPLKHLLESDAISVQYEDDVKVITQNADYLSKLVGELLDYIRNEKDGYAISLVPVNVTELIDRLKLEFTAAAVDRNLKVNFQYPKEVPVIVMAEESALTKILNNLLHNAVKYARTSIDVRLSVMDENAEVKVIVSNDGEPIPEDKKEEIFKPFVQYVTEGSYVSRKGFGIGLAFARSLATGLGGSLVLGDNSESISFVLTLKQASAEDTETAVVLDDTADNNSSGEVVLVVEDNGSLREYLYKRLSVKYIVVVAESEEQASEILRRRRVSLVISDISLPKASGLELCRKISSSFEYSHIPVILMSSFGSDKIKLDAVNSGAALFLEKPFDMDYLEANVDSLMNKSIVAVDDVRKSLSQKLRLVSQRDQVFLETIEEYIKENISDVLLDNESMAKHMNISVPTLQRKVKSLTGLTPNRYIRKYRIDIAARLLASGTCRINEVCYSVGFNSPSYFAKCFREEYGCLPQDYMKENMSDKVVL